MKKNSRQSFCIHGHFYQPPREDPLTGEIPLEPGAAPYPNWNERIHDQCYRPNAELGNFSRISFDLGPTLANWMAKFYPSTLEKIKSQEHESYKKFGVGNAIAQPYHHTILPLSTYKDKVTQVKWGVQDFNLRFGHSPAGMWLPETAVDLETLQVLADNNIQYTILAPWQAQSVVDTSNPYQVRLSNDRTIAVFFYDSALSSLISFSPESTVNADNFLANFVSDKLTEPKRPHNDKYLLLASDGELYGHHQPFRDKFLEYLTTEAIKELPYGVVPPGVWLRSCGNLDTVQIVENTSWSCHHGVMRWKGKCDCTPHSTWKEPFRNSLDALGREIDTLYVEGMQKYDHDTWETRNQYGSVVCGEESPDEFVQRVFGDMTEPERTRLIVLLTAQVERQRMFTSCGWFFDDLDRIEPRNNIFYAAQAVWLTKFATGKDLAGYGSELLSKVSSWRSGLTGDIVFQHHLQRADDIHSSQGLRIPKVY